MGSPTSGNRIAWFDIPCVDLDRAIAFYSVVLGMEIPKMEQPGFSMGVLPHESDTVGGCLVALPDYSPSETGVLIYLNCDGRLDEAEAAVAGAGGTVLEPKHTLGPHGWRTLIKDSEGNRVALHST